MFTKTLLGVGALLSVAAAVPMQQLDKRDIVWVTKTAETIVTIDVTTTIWLKPGETPPVAPAAGSPAHFGHHHHSKITSTIHVTVPAPSPPAASPPAEPSPETTHAVPSPVSPPETPTTPAVAPTPTSTYTPPPATVPAPAPAPTHPSSGGGTGSGSTYTGDLTYYTPGLGSCGQTNGPSDSIVALAEGMMEASMPANGNPNDNPLCGKSITITWQGKTAQATIMDTCPGCSGGSLDLTPSLFEQFAPLSVGRLTGMTWQYN